MIVLDTHAWIWWVDGDLEKLSSIQIERIRSESNNGRIGVCAISCWEIAIKVALDREDSLVLSLRVEEWIGFALSYPGVELIPLSPEIAIKSTKLIDPPNQDPFDKLIIASAIQYRCPLVTSDKEMRAYPHVETI